MDKRETRLLAKVIEARGTCSAGHKKGDVIALDCLNPGGLCGHFYHQMYPDLQTLENGGKMPWWEGLEFTASCADPVNTITLKVTKRGE